MNHRDEVLQMLKYEVAEDLGIHLNDYNGDKTTRDMGTIGGHMVKRLVEMALANHKATPVYLPPPVKPLRVRSNTYRAPRSQLSDTAFSDEITH